MVRMWEVRGYPRTFDQLLQWVCEVAVPQLKNELGHRSSEVFASIDQRIVVISRWHRTPPEMPTLPEGLEARSSHVWDFSEIV